MFETATAAAVIRRSCALHLSIYLLFPAVEFIPWRLNSLALPPLKVGRSSKSIVKSPCSPQPCVGMAVLEVGGNGLLDVEALVGLSVTEVVVFRARVEELATVLEAIVVSLL